MVANFFTKLLTSPKLLGKKAAEVAADPKKFFSSAGYLQRGALAATYLAPTIAFNKYVSDFEERKRNYYGDERYEEYYGSGASGLKGLSILVGGMLTAQALLGRDPISRFITEGKHLTAKARLFSPKRALSRQQKELTFAEKEISKIEDELGGIMGVAAARKGQPVVEITKEQNVKKLGRIGELKARSDKLRPAVEQLTSSVKEAEQKVTELAKQPRVLTPFYAARIASYSAAYFGVNSGSTGIAGTAVGLAAGIGVLGLGSAIHAAGGKTATAVAAAASYGMYKSATTIKENMPAEGTIIDVSMGNEPSGVSKMNFSTAGLVFALHQANRKY